MLIDAFDLEHGLRDGSGALVYVSAVRGLACGEDGVWLVDAAGRLYGSPSGGGLRSGGRLHLGPGAAGRQVDLSQLREEHFAVELQPRRVRHQSRGDVLAYPGRRGTENCERWGRRTLEAGERSMWIPVRLGEPFRVTILDSQGVEIPAGKHRVEVEERPGIFGTQYDYFRVTNLSGETWRDVRFAAEVLE